MFPSANPEMLILGRQSRGKSQVELANRIQRSAGLISKVENGIVPATLGLVEDIATDLRYPASFFFRPERVRGSDSVCFHHRKRQAMPSKLLATVEAQMHVTQLHIKSLLSELEVQSPNGFVTLDVDTYDGSPQRVAQILRSLWRLPAGPVPDMVRVIESAGGVVVFRHFGTPKLDGLSCWAKGCPPLFFVNAEIPADRARLTLAHELGHLVMHFTPPTANPETEANEFALEFLAPAADIVPDLRNLRFAQLPGLKAKWGLSMAALIMAAGKTGAVPPSKVKSFWVLLSRNGYRTVEPFPLPSEKPSMLQRAIALHYDEHDYSVEELAALVDLLPEEFVSLYESPEEERPLSVLS
jgi:Zn-dependent peptidase ImmA (M78 family)/transcriptional regulator with XRE-family HTH domain